jgi:hypothetical protein
MKLYRLDYRDADGVPRTKWFGDGRKAISARAALRHDGLDRKTATVERVEIPDLRAAFIEWMNAEGGQQAARPHLPPSVQERGL